MVLILALACSPRAEPVPTETGSPPTADTGAPPVEPPGIVESTPGTTAYTLQTDDGPRTFEVHVPLDYHASVSHGLVFFFHGGNGDSQIDWSQFLDIVEVSGIVEQAHARGMVVVTPDALMGNWADGRGTTDAELAGVDDVAFVEALADILVADLAIDPGRLYVTGFSNGGIFSNTLACELPGRFAATSGVAALMPTGLVGCPASPTPRVQIQGAADPFQDWQGDPAGNVASSHATASHWVTVNGCTDATEIDGLLVREDGDGPVLEHYRGRGCTDGADVDFYVIEGQGHAWPPDSEEWDRPVLRAIVGDNTDVIDATATFLDFFEAHAGR